MTFPADCDKYEKVVVSRHKALVDYLIKEGIVDEGVEVSSHVYENQIEGKHVIGMLPYHVACHAAMFTEIPLRIPYDKKHTELTTEEIVFYMQQPRTYKIEEVK